MTYGFESLEQVLAGVVGCIAADQIILEHGLSIGKPNSATAILLRNKFNLTLLSQLLFLAQNQPEISVKAVSLISCINKASNEFDSSSLELNIERDKPLIDVLADKKCLTACLVIILCLIKLENLTTRKIKVGIRRRGGYVSVKFEAGVSKSNPSYLGPVLAYTDHVLSAYSGNLDWRLVYKKRVVFLRLGLAKQMPLDYNR